jgi:hypothetical protein
MVMTPIGGWWLYWYVTLFFVAFVWAGPIGLFVLRKHLANASGARSLVKAGLTVWSVATAPLAGIMAVMVVAGAADGVYVVWTLLRNTW